ncbi:MAG: hypothetical protein NTV58_00535 [Deltaproteobacteria bacterium]|nr:hypothetical protein [Deltaproteobacteria bacterium]
MWKKLIVVAAILSVVGIGSSCWAWDYTVTVKNVTPYKAKVNFYYNAFTNINDLTVSIEPGSSYTYNPSPFCPAGLTGIMQGSHNNKQYTAIILASDNAGRHNVGLWAGCWSSAFIVDCYKDDKGNCPTPPNWKDNATFVFSRQ